MKDNFDESIKNNKPPKKRSSGCPWIVKIVIITFFLTVILTFISENLLTGTGYFVAFAGLLAFTLLGILFDIVGVAVAVADEKVFHSMASHKEVAASEALMLVKASDKVSNFCNDVVGDIAGIVSGATSAIIVGNLVSDFNLNTLLMQLIFSGCVASLTIGGKALGKKYAMQKSTQIVYTAARIIYFFKRKRKNK